MSKLYRQITLTDDQRNVFFLPHKIAMTSENLHSKSEIAYELGSRDMRIAELEKELKALVSEVKDLGSVSYDQFPDTTSAEKLLKEQVK
jgi:hypothetical protein